MALIGNNNHKSVLDENASLFQNTEKKSEKQGFHRPPSLNLKCFHGPHNR